MVDDRRDLATCCSARFRFGEPNMGSVVSRRRPVRPATEDIAMIARKGLFSFVSRNIVVATVTAVALTAGEPSQARAASAPSGKGLSAAAASGATDFSARRRYYRGGGGAAA